LGNYCRLHDIKLLWPGDSENMFTAGTTDFDNRPVDQVGIKLEFFIALFTLNNHA
jgi:hypothetical protein